MRKEVEGGKSLLVHVEEGARALLLRVLLRVRLVDSRPVVLGVSPEGDFELLEEFVHAAQQLLGGASGTVDTRGALVHHHAVCQVRGHDEVMLDDEAALLGVHDEALDHTRTEEALLRVQVSGGLIDEVDVGGLAQTQHNRRPLELAAGEVLDVVVDDVFHVERLDHVGDELRVDVRVPDLRVQQLADGAFELGRDLLGLVGHVQLGHPQLRHLPLDLLDVLLRLGVLLGALLALLLLLLVLVQQLAPLLLVVRQQQPSEHLDESGLSGAVLSEHHHDLRVREVPGLDLEPELGVGLLLYERLDHVRVLVRVRLRALQELLGIFGDFERESGLPETKVLRGDEACEEDVDAVADVEGHGDDAIRARHAVEHADEVGEVVQHCQVVLHHHDVVVLLEEAAHSLARVDALLHVEVGGGLVEHVDVCLLHRHHRDRKPLQLASREILHATAHHVFEVENVD
mmetsp:Transcript_62608/g.147236  ORF Transcript_62608/g.147236 Transcript_62608/m.147236 type:complete len:458 (-) Transcript_62608:690-2063(-)